MKEFQSLKRLVLLIMLTALSSELHSFTDLMREYRKFEQLITKEDSIISLDGSIQSYSNSPNPITTRAPQKPWTFIVYMASDNDLRAFAANNIRQMASLGSNQNVNIVVHLDIRLNGNQKITRRYFIEKNKLTHLNKEPETQSMDSGDPKTLISCCDWAIKNFPAQNYALILWNHGTGVIDPRHSKIINPAELFSFNPTTNKLELDRSIGFLDFLYFADLDQRGICWDNTTGNYLTNEKLNGALNEICTRILKKKFSLIGFDACLMSMIEIAHIMKKYADVMVGSQEVELGTGWNYAHVLQPLLNAPIDVKSFANHIVTSYKRSYHTITNDFTQSALDLQKTMPLEKNIDTVARLLLEAIHYQQNNSVIHAIKSSRNRKNCTHFDEPSYIDLHHFYGNLQNQLSRCTIQRGHQNILQQLIPQITQGKQLISDLVFANMSGQNLKEAKGVSIYFPEQRIHPSYTKAAFAQSNAWCQLIETCK